MRTQSVWYTLLKFWAQLIFSALFGIRVYGQHNVPRTGAVILASSHQSYLDPVIVGVGLTRPIHFMARESLFRNVFFRRLIELLNAFPVERNSADLGAMHEALRRLRNGCQLLLFPEGTRTRNGDIGRLHPGLGILALRSEAAVVPVSIEGAFRCWPRGRKIFRPGKILVMIGRPMRVSSTKREELQSFVEELRGRLVEQQQELRRIDRLRG